ncbi:MAG: LamG-like jellyroll fold domain-containing protein [Opitutaceae bacterium]|nr:LamG-like jellyroll fold domain-containing protein [Opitutaceae bacterium]
MHFFSLLLVVSFLAGALAVHAAPAAPVTASTRISDPRHISSGWNIPSEGYADQPYIVQTDDGAWLCVITTGRGVEGAAGQHVVSMRSTNRGRSWDQMVAIEPADGPEASYAVLLKVPGGRIYAFYNHNTDNVREVKREDRGVYKRVDSLGYYVFKYTDDHGRTWSAQRHRVPVREFACDRDNVYGGKIRFFWNVGRPLIVGDVAILVLHKVGAMGAGFFAQSEGAFLRSRNILTERDPAKITFETLPDGDVGLRTPAGGDRVAEEQSIAALSDGSLYCVYRSTDGWPVDAYSRDGGHTWSPPAYKTYTPGGRRVKHPRAANFVWRCGNGNFLYWFHNHGGPIIARMQADSTGATGNPYDDRNPAWLMAGIERDTTQGKIIEWSQPEILLYDDDPFIRMSYPDLVEEGGRFYVTETQKNIGRVHEIPGVLVAGLFNQFDVRTVARDGLALDWPENRQKDGGGPRPSMPAQAAMPKLPEFHLRDGKRADHGGADQRAGFSLDLWFQLDANASPRVLLDNRDTRGRGLELGTTPAGAIRLVLNDGRTESAWESDAGAVRPGTIQHLVVTVDGGPKIITFVVDGVLCDGGDERQFGWGRFSPHLRAPNGAATVKIDSAVRSLRIYQRALRTSEAVGNHRAGL